MTHMGRERRTDVEWENTVVTRRKSNKLKSKNKTNSNDVEQMFWFVLLKVEM